MEVKSAHTGTLAGIARFQAEFPPAKAVVAGPEGIELGEFLSRPARDWV